MTDHSFTDGYHIVFGTGYRRDNLYSTFLQDEVKLTNSMALTIGSKFEHNAYTGFEYEPSAQLVWTPTDRQTVWASASKAILDPPCHAAFPNFAAELQSVRKSLSPDQLIGLHLLLYSSATARRVPTLAFGEK